MPPSREENMARYDSGSSLALAFVADGGPSTEEADLAAAA
jgi:hypothetical protein